MKKDVYRDKKEFISFLRETNFLNEPQNENIKFFFFYAVEYLSIALADYTPFKNITTFNKLVKLVAYVVNTDVNNSNKILEERRKLLKEHDFNGLTDSDKQAIENEVNSLPTEELNKLVFLDNDFLQEKNGLNYNQLENKEVYKLSYASYRWITIKNKTDLKLIASFKEIKFINDSNRKKADRIAKKISNIFYEFTIKKQSEDIKRPTTENPSKNDALFMVETHGKKTEKIASDLQMATIKVNPNTNLYLELANKEEEYKNLLKVLGTLETEKQRLAPNSKEYKAKTEEIEKIQTDISVLSENFIVYRSLYHAVDSEEYKTTLNLEIEGFYNVFDKDGNRIGILPPRVIVSESKEYDQIFKALTDIALKNAPNEIISEFSLSNSDIAEIMGLDPYDDYNILTERERTEYGRRKKVFLDVVRYELEQINFDLPSFKGHFLHSDPIGENYYKGIKITIFRDYLNLLLNEGKGNEYNTACEDLKSKNAITMYKEICREVFINRNKATPNEYNYTFSLKKLRKLGKYNSTDAINKAYVSDEKREEKNKYIRKCIRQDLKLLYDSGLILISKINGVAEFTIYPLNERISKKEQQETFYKLIDANGHDPIC